MLVDHKPLNWYMHSATINITYMNNTPNNWSDIVVYLLYIVVCRKQPSIRKFFKRYLPIN